MLDTNFINPFITSAIEALKVQGGLVVEAGKPFVKGKEPMPTISIAGQLGLTSTQFRGAIHVSFEEKVFLKMMSNMIGEELKEITVEIQDGAAEMVNIIYGTAKTQLNSRGYDLQRAIPIVIAGDNLKFSVSRAHPAIVIPLRSPEGFVFIEITVDPT
jgi:chemotaxis protein CheX